MYMYLYLYKSHIYTIYITWNYLSELPIPNNKESYTL